MAKRDDIPKTDPSEIEALIQRLKHSNLEPRTLNWSSDCYASCSQWLRFSSIRRFDQAAQAIDVRAELRQARCHWKFDGKLSAVGLR